MSEEHLFINLKMWIVVDEDGDWKVRYKYMLPEITHEVHADMYRIFFETLCDEVAKKENSATIYKMLVGEVDDSEG
jgi:hypothetical protein